jgi:hypothetical protein
MCNSAFHLNDVGRAKATAKLGELICPTDEARRRRRGG